MLASGDDCLSHCSDALSLEVVLESGPDGSRHSRMDYEVGNRCRFPTQARHVVVLNVIPLDVEKIEGIQRQQPFAGVLVAKLQIEWEDRGVV